MMTHVTTIPPSYWPVIRRTCLIAICIFMSGCAHHTDWRLATEQDAAIVYLRNHPTNDHPEFRGEITINGSISTIMQVLTDFSRYPEWVYRCEKVEIIDFISYNESYLYQVNKLPMVRDRDLIMHGKIVNHRAKDTGTNSVTIRLQAVPDYCTDNDSESCVAINQRINQSGYIRVTDSQGEFRLTELANNQVKVTWQQDLDPAGWLPHWLVRLMMTDIPLITLNNLKMRVELNE